jgi:hypothetical protein
MEQSADNREVGKQAGLIAQVRLSRSSHSEMLVDCAIYDAMRANS